MAGRVVRRGYRYAQLPEWIIYHPDLSDRAVRLFAALDRAAGSDDSCYPSRADLAAKLSCSVDTIDRAKAELVDAGALEVEHRTVCRPGQKPRHTSNLYYLNGDPPDQGGRIGAATSGGTPAATGSRTPAARGGRTDAAQTESHLERENYNDDDDVTETPPATSTSSSSDHPHWPLIAEAGLVAARVRVPAPRNPDAFATRAAQNILREQGHLLDRLIDARPDLDQAGLAFLLVTEGAQPSIDRARPVDISDPAWIPADELEVR